MRTRKNALVLFSKVPVPGMVKTRLTVLKDGAFDPETACQMYQCMLFDVVECICRAMNDLDQRAKAAVDAALAAGEEPVLDQYELVISTTPASNVPVMEELLAQAGEWPRPIHVICDEGSSFDEHYNCSFDKTWARGADCILSMGADMPALTKADVFAGFDALHRLEQFPKGGIVLAPDQEMGVSVVGWTKDTDFSHDGVYYNRQGLTVLPAYIQKARQLGLPALYLPPIPDVDTMQDLMHNITVVEALNYCAESGDDVCPPHRMYELLKDLGIDQVSVAPNDLHDPRTEIDGCEPEE
ncbi:MAG: DUF2064 domain-containing protein [Coriobacteriia bacterium]|nr:DUF2064 domain-containing protein [Coriobacteriia bacterium]